MKKIILLSAFILSFTFQLFSQSNNFIPAYDTMHRFIRENYPFGQWKAIKWEEIDNRIRPAIVQAASTNDTVAYYLALKRYVASIHDGHVGLKGTGWKAIDSIARYRYIGGSFGFALTEMDDGRLVARLVLPSTPAALAGMQYGAEIISINDQPAKNVRDTVEVLFGDSNPATLECKRMNQDRLVGRAPVGKSMKIKFRNRGSADPVETTIVAVDDHYESFDKTTMGFVEPGPIVSYKILDPEMYGYL
ncbi:MAG: PDZ domain-containing protein [Bacteroidota bacterium]|nr:PDZ domain-containing protein [Bacteroidota bacterium]